MSIFDSLLGRPSQSVLEPNVLAARDMLLARILEQMDQGPIDVPSYFAPIPQTRFSGANNLLASLGLEQVNPSNNLPLEDVAGVQALSTQSLSDQMIDAMMDRQLAEIAPEINTPDANAPVGGSGGSGGGSDPYHGGDHIADFLDPNNRMGMRELMDRKNYAAADDAAGGEGRMYYGQNEKGDIISVGYGANQVDPGLASAAGYTRREDNPFNYSIGDHFSKIGSDVKNIAETVIDDVSKFSPVAQIGNILSNAVNTVTSSRDDSPSPLEKQMAETRARAIEQADRNLSAKRPKGTSFRKSGNSRGFVGGF